MIYIVERRFHIPVQYSSPTHSDLTNSSFCSVSYFRPYKLNSQFIVTARLSRPAHYIVVSLKILNLTSRSHYSISKFHYFLQLTTWPFHLITISLSAKMQVGHYPPSFKLTITHVLLRNQWKTYLHLNNGIQQYAQKELTILLVCYYLAMQVTALIPLWMLLKLESMRLYKKCDTEVTATIKKNSHHKFDNAITTKN